MVARRAFATKLLVHVLSLAVLAATLTVGSAGLAEAAVATYTATQTIPVPPASTYAGAGGGDGWAVALDDKAVYNVFHHNADVVVACHVQSDASSCWAPRRVTDVDGGSFGSSAHPGLWLNRSTGRLYTFATRAADGTGGVVCIDLLKAAAASSPFCGFTVLTLAGDSPYIGMSTLSAPALVGTRWYAFNHYPNTKAAGARNALLCFETSTVAPCKKQPFSTGFGDETVAGTSYPAPQVAALGDRVVVAVPGQVTERLTCFDALKSTTCAGSWPVAAPGGYVSNYGPPFPVLGADGAVAGLCLPTGVDPCYSLSGAPMNSPDGLRAAVPATSGWNGPSLSLGRRVYLPDGVSDTVRCFDWQSNASCPSFPKRLDGLGLLYSVNPDPSRPTCLWVNADNGAGQIQNFDAYSGGACGRGPIRVLASSFVVPTQLCKPATYTSLQVVNPPRSDFASGSVEFRDFNADPISGATPEELDGNATVNLSSKKLSTAAGLPQFLITLRDPRSTIGKVSVKLTWTGSPDASCAAPGTTVVGDGGDSTGECGDAVMIAARGSGEPRKTPSDVTVSPTLEMVYRSMQSAAPRKTVKVRVLDYPARGLETLTAGLGDLNGLDSSKYIAKYRDRLAANVGLYLGGKDVGVDAMWNEFASVRLNCPAGTKIVLAGYSQGAMVVHEFLNELASTSDEAGKGAVVGAVLIADPERVRESTVLNLSDALDASSGVCQAIKAYTNCPRAPTKLGDVSSVFAGRTVQVCSSNDFVCDTSDFIGTLRDAAVNGEARQAVFRYGVYVHTTYRWVPETRRAGEIIGGRIARA